MAYNFGDVILVPFPFTNQSGAKKRPAVVVSSDSYSLNRRDIIIIAVTGQVRLPLNSGEALLADWKAAGLVKASVLKPVFATLEQGLVIQTLGVLTDEDKQRLRQVVSGALG